jgi:prepilin-type N-terminal cleavage/methylation domain-containing protein
MRHATMRRRQGFTLIEVMISMMLLLILMAAATGFFRTQLRALSRESGRFDALQNSNYAVNLLDQEIRAAGVGTPSNQPLVVQASPDAITFNGDLVSRVKNDPASVYYDPDASAQATDNLNKADAFTLPLYSNVYPKANYTGAAETISYWVRADTVSNKTDELMLMRQVNKMSPRLVARGIKKITGQPIFTFYSKLNASDNAGFTPITGITATAPAFHSDSIHTGSDTTNGSTAGSSSIESAGSKLVDAIAMVRVQITTIYRDARGDSAQRTVTRNIRVMNSGLTDQPTCGGNPAPPSNARAPGNIYLATDVGVDLEWAPSTDEKGGARDVARYFPYKRLSTDPAGFTEPFTIIAADGNVSPTTGRYEYLDSDVLANKTYYYGIASQDCGLATSAIVQPSNKVDVRP